MSRSALMLAAISASALHAQSPAVQPSTAAPPAAQASTAAPSAAKTIEMLLATKVEPVQAHIPFSLENVFPNFELLRLAGSISYCDPFPCGHVPRVIIEHGKVTTVMPDSDEAPQPQAVEGSAKPAAPAPGSADGPVRK